MAVVGRIARLHPDPEHSFRGGVDEREDHAPVRPIREPLPQREAVFGRERIVADHVGHCDLIGHGTARRERDAIGQLRVRWHERLARQV